MDWLGEQNAGGMVQGPMGSQHAFHIVANKQDVAASYARSYMEQHAPIQTIEKGNLEQSYQDHQVTNSTTKDHMTKVMSQSNVQGLGSDMRDEVMQEIKLQQNQISQDGNLIGDAGEILQGKVNAQQGTSVVANVGRKGFSEVKEMGSDVKKLWNGEPQQK